MSINPTERTQPASSPLLASTRNRLVAVVVIVIGIIGIAWLIGNQQGFGSIGQGGVNAKHLPEVGDVAPEIITFDTAGNVVRLSDFRGQPVWLNFWGSWCPPCRAEFPDIQAAYDDLNAEGLIMLGIAVGEDPRVAQDYANRVGGTFPILADPGYIAAVIPEDQPEMLAAAEEMATSYTINNYPTHIFINRDGTVGAVVISPMSYDDAMGFGEQALASPMPGGIPPQQPNATPSAGARPTRDDE
jgi:thiol-disulfide isomerase/thioredoxin